MSNSSDILDFRKNLKSVKFINYCILLIILHINFKFSSRQIYIPQNLTFDDYKRICLLQSNQGTMFECPNVEKLLFIKKISNCFTVIIWKFSNLRISNTFTRILQSHPWNNILFPFLNLSPAALILSLLVRYFFA